MRRSDPISALLVIDGKSDDPVRQPTLSRSGEIALAEGETVIASWSCVVSWDFMNDKKRLEALPGSETPASVDLTDRRILLRWPEWKKDIKGVTERLAIRGLTREDGEMMLAGHVRHSWIVRAGYTEAKGLMSKKSDVFLIVNSAGTIYRMRLVGMTPDLAAASSKRIASVVAGHHARHTTPNETDSAKLAALQDGRAAFEPSAVGASLPMPTGVQVGKLFSAEHAPIV